MSAVRKYSSGHWVSVLPSPYAAQSNCPSATRACISCKSVILHVLSPGDHSRPLLQASPDVSTVRDKGGHIKHGSRHSINASFFLSHPGYSVIVLSNQIHEGTMAQEKPHLDYS